MKNKVPQNLHSLVGGMTTDYFDFFCKGCGGHINRIEFYGIDSVGVRLRSKCPECGLESIFKIKTHPPLGPIQMINNRYGKNRGYKLYDGRRLKKHLREVDHPVFSQKKPTN
jgi:hypothetical protein